MKRKTLRKSDIRKLNENIKGLFGLDNFFDKKDYVEEVFGSRRMIFKDNCIVFFFYGNKLVPSLRLCLKQDVLKKITVDMGAVKFVASGADVMRPGIINVEDGIEKNDFVVVVDENNKKPLAVCTTLFLGEEIKAMGKGKVLKNLHCIGDDIWNFC